MFIYLLHVAFSAKQSTFREFVNNSALLHFADVLMKPGYKRWWINWIRVC